MKLQDLTTKEQAMIRSLFNNYVGENGDGIWSHSTDHSSTPHNLPTRSVAGVVSSLIKKGLMYSDPRQAGEDAGVLGLLPVGQQLAANDAEEAELARLDGEDRGDFEDEDDREGARREESAAAHRAEY